MDFFLESRYNGAIKWGDSPIPSWKDILYNEYLSGNFRLHRLCAGAAVNDDALCDQAAGHQSFGRRDQSHLLGAVLQLALCIFKCGPGCHQYLPFASFVEGKGVMRL